MGDTPAPHEPLRQRAGKEYEDPHFHDEDEVSPVPDDNSAHRPRTPPKTSKLPPRPRRFDTD